MIGRLVVAVFALAATILPVAAQVTIIKDEKYLELITVRSDREEGPSPGPGITEFFPGYAVQEDAGYRIVHNWSVPPSCINFDTGFEIAVTVNATTTTANAAPGTRAGADSGFEIVPEDGLASIYVEAGKSGGKTQTVKFKPYSTLNIGSKVTVWVGMQWYDYYYYDYEVKLGSCKAKTQPTKG